MDNSAADNGGAAKVDFTRGYLIAVANIVHISGDYRAAYDTLREGGITRDEMRNLDLTDYDVEVLEPLFDGLDDEAAA